MVDFFVDCRMYVMNISYVFELERVIRGGVSYVFERVGFVYDERSSCFISLYDV